MSGQWNPGPNPRSVTPNDHIPPPGTVDPAQYGHAMAPPVPLNATAAHPGIARGSRQVLNALSRAWTTRRATHESITRPDIDEVVTQLAFDGLTPLPIPNNPVSLEASLRGHAKSIDSALNRLANNELIVTNGPSAPFYPLPPWATENNQLDIEAIQGSATDAHDQGATEVESIDSDDDTSSDYVPDTNPGDNSVNPASGTDAGKGQNDANRYQFQYDDMYDVYDEDLEFVLFPCPEDDDTVPETREERRALAGELFVAMKNNENTIEKDTNRIFIKRWKDGAQHYTDLNIERQVWRLLGTLIELYEGPGWLHPIEDPAQRKKVLKTANMTFRERFDTVVTQLKQSKKTCDVLLGGGDPWKIIGNAAELSVTSKHNEIQNAKKTLMLAKGRQLEADGDANTTTETSSDQVQEAAPESGEAVMQHTDGAPVLPTETVTTQNENAQQMQARPAARTVPTSNSSPAPAASSSDTNDRVPLAEINANRVSNASMTQSSSTETIMSPAIAHPGPHDSTAVSVPSQGSGRKRSHEEFDDQEHGAIADASITPDSTAQYHPKKRARQRIHVRRGLELPRLNSIVSHTNTAHQNFPTDSEPRRQRSPFYRWS